MLSLEFQIDSFVADCQFNLSSLISNEAGSDLLHLSECQSARGNLNIWLVSIHPLVLSTPRSTVPAPVLSISSSNTSSSLPPRATGSVLNARLPIAVLLCSGFMLDFLLCTSGLALCRPTRSQRSVEGTFLCSGVSLGLKYKHNRSHTQTSYHSTDLPPAIKPRHLTYLYVQSIDINTLTHT